LPKPEKAMKNEIWKAPLIQLALSVLYVIGIAVWEMDALFSAIVGCMAGLIPNTYIYYRMSRQAENDSATQFLGYAYRSELGKWLMTGMIFMLAFTSDHVWDPVFLFAGYVLVQVSSGFVAFVTKGN